MATVLSGGEVVRDTPIYLSRHARLASCPVREPGSEPDWVARAGLTVVGLAIFRAWHTRRPVRGLSRSSGVFFFGLMKVMTGGQIGNDAFVTRLVGARRLTEDRKGTSHHVMNG